MKVGGLCGQTGQAATRSFDHSDLLYCIIFSFGGYVTAVDPFLLCLSGGTAEQLSVFVTGSICLKPEEGFKVGLGRVDSN